MRQSPKTALSEPTTRRTTLHAVAACLAASAAFAVTEAIVRYLHTADEILPAQLALAIFANVAFLGLVSGTILAVGVLLAAIVRRAVPQVDEGNRTWHSAVLAGAVGGILVYLTDGVGIGEFQPSLVSLCAVGVAATIFLLFRYTPVAAAARLSSVGQIVAIAAWLFATGMTTANIIRTDNHLDDWLTRESDTTSTAERDAPNIVLVVLDTLRADRVGAYSGTDLTPNLDELAESSITYTNALSTAPWTLPSHASLFTGLYPSIHGVNWGHFELDDRYPTLADLLHKRGYDTFAVSNNRYLSEENGYARGFDSFLWVARDELLNAWRLALRCGAPRRAAVQLGMGPDTGRDAGSGWTNWMLRRRLDSQSASRPFFAFINYLEVHSPYHPFERHMGRLLTPAQREAYRTFPQHPEHMAAQACGIPNVYSTEHIELLSALYDGEVAYQDEVIGDLVRALNERRLLEDTWLIVTSDHGELFGEHDMVFHVAGSHYQLLHVPLFVRPPGGIDGCRVATPAQPVDIFRTLVEVAGADLPPAVRRAYPLPMNDEDPASRRVAVAETFGASLISMASSRRINMQTDLSPLLTWLTSIWHDDHVLEIDSDGLRALYDVNDDPRMNDDLLNAMPGLADSLVNYYREWGGRLKEEEPYERETVTRNHPRRDYHPDFPARAGDATGRSIH